MRHSLPAPLRRAGRAALAVALSAALLGASGCGWFRKDANMFAMSEAERPLEVPPEMATPGAAAQSTAGGTQSALRSQTGAQRAQASAAAAGTGFSVSAPRAQVFARVGEVLGTVEGLEVASRAELLGAYDVSYRGSDFLVRVSEVEAGTYVSAVDPRGLPAQGDGPSALLAVLKAALGGN